MTQWLPGPYAALQITSDPFEVTVRHVKRFLAPPSHGAARDRFWYDGRCLHFDHAAWQAFVAAVKAGDFDPS